MHIFGWKLVRCKTSVRLLRNNCFDLDDMKGGGRIMDVDIDDQFSNRNVLHYGRDITDHIKCKKLNRRMKTNL